MTGNMPRETEKSTLASGEDTFFSGIFLRHGTEKTVRASGPFSGSAKGSLLGDGFRRAARDAGAAIDAFAFIDRGGSVLHGDSFDRTGPDTCFTSDAFGCINFRCHNKLLLLENRGWLPQ